MSRFDRRALLRYSLLGAAAGMSGSRIARAQLSAVAPAAKAAEGAGNDVMSRIGAYVAEAATTELPLPVVEIAKSHILDTLSAMVSGSRLVPGQLAAKFVLAQRGAAEAQVVASKQLTSAINAAFANAMMAHSDETDDSHRLTLVHPGAAIVPAALALSERTGAGGRTFLRSVVVGYEVGCRMVLALGPDRLLQGAGATPGIGGCIGAASACAIVAGIDRSLIPYLFSYAVQQASGVNSWVRDQEHVEKAFVFGGMPARNGVTAVELAQSGFTGESDPFSGTDNFLGAFSSAPDPSRLTQGLGREFEIMQTELKRFPVGFPIQAVTDAVLKLIARGLVPANIRSLTVHLPAPGVNTVNDRNMPDVNVQYIVAATLVDRTLKFETAHSLERMKDPVVLELKNRIALVEDRELTVLKRTREANVEVVLTDGSTLQEHGIARGALENPMTSAEVDAKARELMTPILGRDRTGRLIDTIRNLERVANMRALRPLLSA